MLAPGLGSSSKVRKPAATRRSSSVLSLATQLRLATVKDGEEARVIATLSGGVPPKQVKQNSQPPP